MSNKTQLQTNNTALDALITRVNAAKDTAASLPETSGGSNMIEVTVTNNSYEYVKYFDENAQEQSCPNYTTTTIKALNGVVVSYVGRSYPTGLYCQFDAGAFQTTYMFLENGGSLVTASDGSG